MVGKRRWPFGLAASAGALGLLATSGVVFLANHFVDELSLPHIPPDERLFSFKLPPVADEPPSSLRRPVTFRTADGKILRGDFWAQPQPAPTVVICHGYRITRNVLRPVAALEYAYGLNILLFDFRGHGDSESVITSGGNAEVRDLEAAINVAIAQPETLPNKIVIHGFSMGASIALLMRPRPEVAAIVADSPYARLDEILQRIIRFQLASKMSGWKSPFRHFHTAVPALSWVLLTTSRAVFLARFRHNLIARPETSLRRWQARKRGGAAPVYPYPPILLIHGLADQSIPITHARKLVEQARAQQIPLQTYFVENATHCAAYGVDPERYIATFRRFLAGPLELD